MRIVGNNLCHVGITIKLFEMTGLDMVLLDRQSLLNRHGVLIEHTVFHRQVKHLDIG